MLLFSLATTILAVLLCGLAPAFSATRAGISLDIKTNSSGHARATQSRLGSFLVASQVALAVTVLAAGGLLLHSLFNLETMDAGFDRDHVLTVDMDGTSAGHTPEKVRGFYDQLLEKARSLPGVRSAAISSFVPLSGRMMGINLLVEGYTARAGEDMHVFLTGVMPGYFDTLGIQLLQGRDFTPQDTPNSPRVAIVNRTLARHYFGEQDPIGKHMQTVEGNRTFQVVGVVVDSKYNSLREDARDFFYLDTLQNASPPAVLCTLSIRVAGNAALLRNTLPELIHSLDGSVRVTKIATLHELARDSVHMDRLIAVLCGAFGMVALTLTCIGLYGVLSFSVARKTNEIGIRVALGAEPAYVFRLFVIRGMRLVMAGLLVGLAGALASASLLKSLLFGVERGDPVTFSGICLLLILSAFAACYFPARRAMSVDPMVALRHE